MKKDIIIYLIPLFITLMVVLVNSLLNIYAFYLIHLPFIIFCLSFALAGFIIGKKFPSKTYLKGALCGFCIVFIFLLINLLFIHNFNIKTLYYYVLIISCTTVGSMLSNLKQ